MEYQQLITQKNLELWAQAAIICPQRYEVYALFAKHYREKDNKNVAYHFLDLAMKYYQEKGCLSEGFLHNEIAILSFYRDEFLKGLEACDKIRFSYSVDSSTRNMTLKNQYYYIKPWKNFIPFKLEVACPVVESNPDKKYRPLNPSIVKHNGKYFINVRMVNFINDRCINYTSMDTDGIIRTRNILIECDGSFNIISQNELIENNNRIKYPSQVIGMEDIRMINWNNKWWGTTSIMDSLPYFSPKIAVFNADDDYQIKNVTRLNGGNDSRCEKNWLPFIKDEELYVIYSWQPFQIKKPNLETGECPVIIDYNCSLNLETFRGSAGPLPYHEGYLAVIHEVIYTDKRHYHHRFVYLNKDFFIEKISFPFYFINRDVEYCCGLSWSLDDKNLILSMGIGDCQAYLITIPDEDIFASLQDIDYYKI